MDDGDLGNNIEEETEIIEESVSHDKRIENDQAHLAPNRWWFASSAFPMIAGTLGPVASAFSICALVRPWRQHLTPGEDVKNAVFVADPIWLTVINAIQLAMAVVSNMFLLLNMTRRVRFTIAQPITIIGWYISAILLIALLGSAAGPLYEGFKHPTEELIWSQAFYYGMWAAILYFVDASLMLVTFYGAWTGHYNKDFNLTPSQRTLMLQTIMFLFYLLLGALVFSNIEGWNYLDAVYWADVTLFTVGFGDYTASTTLGRALMMPYALVGVISLGLVVGSIRSLVLERGKRQVDARMEEKKRRRLVRRMTRRGEDDMLEPIRDPQRRQSSFPQDDSEKRLPATEFERRKSEFELMRKIQAQTSSRRRWMAMAISTSTWLILWLLGAYVFVKCEENYQGWNYFDGFYFCFVSLTTIGYGDKTPASNAGKSFFVFWSLLALPTMTVLISNAGDTVVKFIRDGTLRLGNVTILPGEEGSFSDDLKYIIHRCTLGLLFSNHKEPPAPRHAKKLPSAQDSSGDAAEAITNMKEGEGSSRGRPQDPRTGDEDPYSERPEHNRNNSTFTSRVRRSLSRIRDAHEELPTGTDFHFLLISEIQALTSHLKSQKPHKYSFEEWAWYLKLIGEDESSANTHRKAMPKPKNRRHQHHHHNKRTDDSPEAGHDRKHDQEHDTAWSWVGNRSPLMGSQEETEWILERLMERLRESLSAEGRRQTTADARRALGAGRRRSPDDTHQRKRGEENV
ncbi:hypothetical protein NW752_006390 [Fusarium irregulare]|uniref:Potassium channel domain-containing protein n=1 Tax=Fusarium irregulare TaxID=2494466 RepID=A0A9W8U9U0_9HYPO|nr:hypothetical protein NW766_006935 [Fusarium irregulare]KAJ4017300.1 hypothetical protein NW752_006390 [Fusarium irregulare]